MQKRKVEKTFKNLLMLEKIKMKKDFQLLENLWEQIMLNLKNKESNHWKILIQRWKALIS